MMPGWPALLAGLRRLFRRSTADRDLDDEVQQYVEQAAEEYRRQGLSPQDAMRAARVEIGSAESVKDQVRGSGWETVLESILRDVVYGLRVLRRSPGFTAVAVVVVALSIGTNTAVFSIVNAALLRPLPVRAPDELAFVYPKTNYNAFTLGEIQSLDAERAMFAGVAAVSTDMALVGDGSNAEATAGEAVTANYFDVLGVTPQIGRALVPALDEAPNAAPVVVISDGLWRRRFHADPRILGKTLRLDSPSYVDSGWRYTIVGVMPADFTGVANPWVPTAYWASAVQRRRESSVYFAGLISDTSTRFGFLIGRRQPGVAIEAMQPLVATRHKTFEAATQNTVARGFDHAVIVRDSRRVRLPLDDAGRIEPSRLGASLMAVAALVLLIGVTNLVGVTIGRGIVRRPEMAVRLSLGASHARVARQFVMEGLLISALGGLGGLIGSRWLVDAFLASLPTASGGRFGQAMLNTAPDVRVLGFTIALVLIVGVTVGLAPIRQASSRNLLSMLGSGSELAPRRIRSRLRYFIVVPQICLCTALLLGAGVAVRAFLKVAFLDPGYRPEQAAAVSFRLYRLVPGEFSLAADARTAVSQARAERWEELERRVLEIAEATPTIAVSSLATALPHSWFNNTTVARRDGFSLSSPHYNVYSASVTPSYFETIGLPLRAGRIFERSDAGDSPKVAIVAESVAADLWLGKSPLGMYVGFHHPASTRTPVWLEVVGVVPDVRTPLSEGEPHPMIYTPMAQNTNPSVVNATTLVARSHGNDTDLVKTLQAIVKQAAADAYVSDGQTLTEAINTARYPRRMTTSLLLSSAVLGLLLASLGLYGVVSFSVAQRVRELGVRAALGADHADIIALVMREGALVAVVGSVLGFVLVFVGIRLVSHNVFAIPALDAVTVVVVPLLLAAVVLLACYVPARRAARVDPMVVLRWQ